VVAKLVWQFEVQIGLKQHSGKRMPIIRSPLLRALFNFSI
jgi:hypothetical protein